MDRAVELARAWLDELGWSEDPEAGETARLFTELVRQFAPGGPEVRPPSTFPVAGSGPVVVRDLPFHSMCVHHLVPFFGTAAVVYAPAGRVSSLGGIARLLHHHARRPQLQERLAAGWADDLFEAIQPEALVVRLVARQMCLELGDARTPGQVQTLALRGEGAERLLPLLG